MRELPPLVVTFTVRSVTATLQGDTRSGGNPIAMQGPRRSLDDSAVFLKGPDHPNRRALGIDIRQKLAIQVEFDVLHIFDAKRIHATKHARKLTVCVRKL